MNLPATQVEAAALALAQQRVAEYRSMGLFQRDAGHVVLRGFMKEFALSHPFHMSTLKDYARRGWEDARLVLDELLAEHAGRGQLPPQLADYVIDRVHPSLPRPRGPQKATHIVRDIVLVGTVSEVAHRFGLKPTRNKLSRGNPSVRASACSIVAAALKLELPDAQGKVSERALESIWERLSSTVFRWEEKLLAHAWLVPKIT
jgi:hypothetical protein